MKETLRELLRALSHNFPDIPFEVCFWDGDAERFGNGAPAFTLTFNTKAAAKSIFTRGAMGFREAYVEGHVNVAGDFKELMRLGMDPRVQQMKLPLSTKAGILLQHLKSINTVKRSPRNIAHHYGVDGVGCTLSEHQAAYAREKLAQEGLQGRITILQQDYRNLNQQFDKFVSIGMFEHVGKGFIPVFMEKVRKLLRPGGIGLLHTVGKERHTPGDAWTMKYIFPGVYIPMLGHVVRTMGEKGLVPVDIENLRLHYAATLDEWAKRFESNAKKIGEMFDERLVRTWRTYLNGSAAAFWWGDVRVYQILFTNGLNNGLPLTRDYLYRQ
jgi:SAM-dependent methyltransferase